MSLNNFTNKYKIFQFSNKINNYINKINNKTKIYK